MSFGGLYISFTGLQVTRKSLETVSHNISNANNPNYVRQSVIHTNTSYTKSADGRLQMGTGVEIGELRQIRDQFLDMKMRREAATFGYHYSKMGVLEDVEGVFNEISTSGLQSVMKDFWLNFTELSKEPDSLTIRGLVHESAVAFAETANHISRQLNDIERNLNKEIINKANEANYILDELAKINQIIKLVEGENSKVRANDYRDERNALVDRLSEILPISTYENTYGEVVVSLQGSELLNGNYISRLEVKDNKYGLGEIYWQNTNQKIEFKEQGELAGLIHARDESIVNYKERLDTMVGTFADKLNQVHRIGYGLDDTTGINFFYPNFDPNTEPGKINAGNIKVNPELSNYNKIAISSQLGSPGNNEIAKMIIELRDSEIKDGMNLDEYYRDIILELGIEREASRGVAENQSFLLRSIDDKRKSISNVSLDEEMSDMIKFQHSYSANSRVINAIDEMIETVVNRVGIVGR